MSIDRPLWYIFLLISLLNLCCVHRKVAKAAIIYNSGFDYPEAMEKGLNYQENTDTADQQDPDRQASDYTPSLLLLRRAANVAEEYNEEEAPDERSSDQAGLCMGNGRVEAPPAVKETQDAIEHVTGLIKAMREHAISMIKDMSELESEFLSSCDECGGEDHANPTTPEPSSCNVCQSAATQEPNSCNACQGKGGSGDFRTDQNKHVKYYNSNPSPNLDTRNLLYDGTASPSPYYYINEYGAPVKNSSAAISALENSSPEGTEFVQQAQQAVKSWKEQIESCRRMLDDAVSQATQHANLESGNSGAGRGLLAALKRARHKDGGQVAANDAKESSASAPATNAKNDASGKGAAPTNGKGGAAVAEATHANNGKSENVNNNNNNNENVLVPDVNEDNSNENSFYNTDASFDNVVDVNVDEIDNNDNNKQLSNANNNNKNNANEASKNAPPKVKNYRKRKFSGKYDKLMRDASVWSSVQ